MRIRSVLLALAALVAAGCTDDGPADTAPSAGEAPPSAGEASRPGEEAPSPGRDSLTDAQIAALVLLINNTEIAVGKALRGKLATQRAQEYARMLVEDHTRLLEAMPAVEGPSRSPPQLETLRAVLHSQSASFATLPAGYSFDAIFAGVQVLDHALAVDSLRRWQGLVETDALRGAILRALPVMESHLRQAREMLVALDRSVDAGRPGPADTVPPTTAPGPETVPADTAAERAAPPDTAAGSPPSG